MRRLSKTGRLWLLFKLQLLGAAIVLLRQVRDPPSRSLLDISDDAWTADLIAPNATWHILSATDEGRRPPHDLRLDWSNLPEQSPLARRIHASQTTCPSSSHDTRYWIYKPQTNGLGQMLHQWSQTVCNAMEADRRVLTRGPFVWMHESCQAEFDARLGNFSYSPLSCYFGTGHELSSDSCPGIPLPVAFNDSRVTNLTQFTAAVRACHALLERDNITVGEFRAASMEWLFSGVTPLVIAEVHRQLQAAFGPVGLPDRNHLVTVHIRWGDKKREMRLQPIGAYLEAIHNLVGRDRTENTSFPLHVYVTSEDATAHTMFAEEAPRHWTIHSSGPHVRNGRPSMKWNAGGKMGLESLGALLLSLEANHYVLTTRSNWSRLINELRLNVVNPRCHDCTRMADLVYGEW